MDNISDQMNYCFFENAGTRRLDIRGFLTLAEGEDGSGDHTTVGTVEANEDFENNPVSILDFQIGKQVSQATFLQFGAMWGFSVIKQNENEKSLVGFVPTVAIVNISESNKIFTHDTNDIVAEVEAAGVIEIIGSFANDGEYTVDSAAYSANTDITVEEEIPDATVDGTINYNRTTPITGVDITGGAGTNFFQVAGDLTGPGEIRDGEPFIVAGANNNNGTYTVVSTSFSVDTTNVVVAEEIPDAAPVDGEGTYVKQVSLDGVDTDTTPFVWDLQVDIADLAIQYAPAWEASDDNNTYNPFTPADLVSYLWGVATGAGDQSAASTKYIKLKTTSNGVESEQIVQCTVTGDQVAGFAVTVTAL